MKSTWNHRFCPVPALLWILLGVGCGHPPGTLADAAVDVDTGPDAAAADDASPLRSLARRGLFAQTPVENRFFDPTFAQIDGVAWSPFHPLSYDVCPVTRLHQLTPLGQPAIRLERPAGQTSGQVVGMAKGAPGPMEVSVWLGRLVGTNVAALRVALYGLFLGGGSAVDLEPDSNLAPVVMDGVTWVRYSAYLADGPLSWAYLWITNQDIVPLFITAPVLVRVTAQTRRTRPRIPAVHRPLLPLERASWRDWQRRLRDRFGGPPR